MKRFDQINVIPFIDIMLVLLAIVLTTATFVAQGRIPVTLPDSTQARAATTERAPIRLLIGADQGLYWNDQPLALAALDDRLAAATPQPVELLVDAGARFQRFVAVTDLLKQHGFTEVAILAKRAA